MSSPSSVVVSYGDVELYASDVSLAASSTSWLNDHLIHLYYAALAQGEVPEAPSPPPQPLSPHIRYIAPESAFILLHETDMDSLREAAEGCDCFESSVLLYFFPLNDHSPAGLGAGGSHWSLLTFHRTLARFDHFDSVPTSSHGRLARALASQLSPLLVPSSLSLPLVPHSSVRQSNSYDCGMYVLLFTQLIAQWEWSSKETADGLDHWLVQRATAAAVLQCRQELRRLIQRHQRPLA